MKKKVLISFVAVVLVIGLFTYTKRYAILISYLQSNTDAQEMIIHEMVVRAKPIIERELQLSFLEKAYTWGTGKRSEKERQVDASADVRKFVESAFKNKTLRFKDVHNLKEINNFSLKGTEIALDWNEGHKEEVLVAFNISLLKRKVESMEVNKNCSFFRELKSYIETRARKN